MVNVLIQKQKEWLFKKDNVKNEININCIKVDFDFIKSSLPFRREACLPVGREKREGQKNKINIEIKP